MFDFFHKVVVLQCMFSLVVQTAVSAACEERLALIKTSDVVKVSPSPSRPVHLCSVKVNVPALLAFGAGDDPGLRYLLDRDGLPKVLQPGATDLCQLEGRGNVFGSSRGLIVSRIKFENVNGYGMKSIRAEIFGCRGTMNTASFTAPSIILTDTTSMSHPLGGVHVAVVLDFRTTQPTGSVLFSVDPEENDFLSIGLDGGRLSITLSQGTKLTMTVKSSAPVNDGHWHSLHLYLGQNVTAYLDGVSLGATFAPGLNLRFTFGEQVTIGFLEGSSMDKDIHALQFSLPEDTRRIMRTPFVGCIRNAQAYVSDVLTNKTTDVDLLSGRTSGSVVIGPKCDIPVPDCYNLLASSSSLVVGDSSSILKEGVLNVLEFWILTVYQDFTLLKTPGYLLQLKAVSGNLYVIMKQGLQSFTDGDNSSKILDNFADGGWHNVTVLLNKTSSASFHVFFDGKNIFSFTGDLIGVTLDKMVIGGDTPVGCIREIRIGDGSTKTPASIKNYRLSVRPECTIQNWCVPNPCKNSGRCKPSGDLPSGFRCLCRAGYVGKLCGQLNMPRSCGEYYAFFRSKGVHDSHDVHDSPYGHLVQDADLREITELVMNNGQSVEVVCHQADSSAVMTLKSARTVSVTQFGAAGSFVYEAKYGLTEREVTDFVAPYSRCQQAVKYECFNGNRFLRNEEGLFTGWWRGRGGSIWRSWGSDFVNQEMCACAMNGSCLENRRCNCESPHDAVDEGVIKDRSHLPVMKLFLGDTEFTKYANVSLGDLHCSDHEVHNSYSFVGKRYVPPRLPMPVNPDPEQQLQVSVVMQFRTVHSSVPLLELLGSTGDTLRIYLYDRSVVCELISHGQHLQATLDAPLNNRPYTDDHWHLLHVHVDGWGINVHVDADESSGLQQRVVWPRLDYFLIGALSVGSTPNYVGAMRGLWLNGQFVDVEKLYPREAGWFKSGIVDRCIDEYCFHGGICKNLYNDVTCDCDGTAFIGYRCTEDVGILLQDPQEVTIEVPDAHKPGLSVAFSLFVRASNAEVEVVRFVTRENVPDVVLQTNGMGCYQLYLEGHSGSFVKQCRYFSSPPVTNLNFTFLDSGVQFKLNDDVSELPVGIPNFKLNSLRIGVPPTVNNGTSEMTDVKIDGCLSRLIIHEPGHSSPRYPLKEPKYRDQIATCMDETVWKHAPWTDDDNFAEEYPEIVIEQIDNDHPNAALVLITAIVLILLVLMCTCLARWVYWHPRGVYKTYETQPLALSPDNSISSAMSNHQHPQRHSPAGKSQGSFPFEPHHLTQDSDLKPLTPQLATLDREWAI